MEKERAARIVVRLAWVKTFWTITVHAAKRLGSGDPDLI